jgi:hypothetical protein
MKLDDSKYEYINLEITYQSKIYQNCDENFVTKIFEKRMMNALIQKFNSPSNYFKQNNLKDSLIMKIQFLIF